MKEAILRVLNRNVELAKQLHTSRHKPQDIVRLAAQIDKSNQALLKTLTEMDSGGENRVPPSVTDDGQSTETRKDLNPGEHAEGHVPGTPAADRKDLLAGANEYPVSDEASRNQAENTSNELANGDDSRSAIENSGTKVWPQADMSKLNQMADKPSDTSRS